MKESKNEICVVVPCNLIYAPYYYRYENLLWDCGAGFDVMIWDRSGRNDLVKGNLIAFELSDNTNNGDWKKVIKFFQFSHFVKKTIKKNKYKKIIFLGSYAGNASFIWRFLEKSYAGRYWFDIRDYTYEWFRPFYQMEKKVIQNAYQCAISSEGYKRFLPNGQYLIAHNMEKGSFSGLIKPKKRKGQAIRISFIGNMNYYNENYRFLDMFGNDPRFRLQYFGTGNEKLQKYCNEKNIENVHFEGAFPVEKTREYYEETDVINNLYGNDTIGLRTALSNKLYYALYLKMPILVCPNTYMEDISKKAGIGFAVDLNDPRIKDEFMSWYETFNENAIGIKNVWEAVCRENDQFDLAFKDYLNRYFG